MMMMSNKIRMNKMMSKNNITKDRSRNKTMSNSPNKNKTT